MAMTWDELVADVTARHPVRESKMFGMPCLKRENGKVVAGLWKDGGLNVKLVDEVQREAALALPGAQLFDPGMGRPLMRRAGTSAPYRSGKPTPMRSGFVPPRNPTSGRGSSSRRSADQWRSQHPDRSAGGEGEPSERAWSKPPGRSSR